MRIQWLKSFTLYPRVSRNCCLKKWVLKRGKNSKSYSINTIQVRKRRQRRMMMEMMRMDGRPIQMQVQIVIKVKEEVRNRVSQLKLLLKKN